MRGIPGLALIILCVLLPVSPTVSANDEQSVAALGRIEPAGGVIRLSTPSTPFAVSGGVLTTLLVSEGDLVQAGQLLAVMESHELLDSRIRLARARLSRQVEAATAEESIADEACVLADVASKEAERRNNLASRDLMSLEEAEGAQGESEAQAASCKAARANALVAKSSIEVAQAELEVHQAEWARTQIKAPFDGKVLRVVAEPGEFVGIDGILEMGRVSEMFAIAEVYETDIRHVKVGQGASVNSDALPAPLSGKVSFIRPMVHKQDEIGTDPAARKDAKVIEVGIRLDNPEAVAALSNLQVEVIIGR